MTNDTPTGGRDDEGVASLATMRIHQRDGFRVWVGGPVPPGAAGITLGNLVIIRRQYAEDEDLMRHETIHVRQWRRYGYVGFLLRYFGSYAVWRLRRKGHLGAYRRIPLEIEAEWVARRLGKASTVDPEVLHPIDR